MPVKVIPEGSSAVVTDKGRRHRGEERDIIQNTYVTDDRRRDDCNLDGEILTSLGTVAGFIKDTDAHITGVLADVAGFVKDVDAHVTGNVKDAEANLGTAMGGHFAGTIGAIKDAQADLERSSGLHFAGSLEAIKDAEADLERSGGIHYADTVKTLKDVEAQIERSAGSRYADTVKTVKDTESTLERADAFTRDVVRQTESTLERSGALTRDVVRQAELAVEQSKAKIIDVLRDLELEQCKGFDNVKEEIQDSRKELLFNQVTGFKDNLIEFKNTQNLMHQLAAAAEKTACQNQMQTLLQFKDQTLLAEKIAAQASRELAECCCEIRTSIAADGQKTRDLINQQEVDRLRERASKAEQALALINLQIGNIGGIAKA